MKTNFFKYVICLLLTSSAFCLADSIPLSDEAKSIKKGIYQHYKGAYYEVLGVSHHSETLEELVMYRMLYGDYGYWVRPVTMFCETVAGGDGQEMPRFNFIGEPGNFDP